MSDWPDDWFRDGPRLGGGPTGGSEPATAPARPPGSPSAGPGGSPGARPAYPSRAGGWPEQPPVRTRGSASPTGLPPRPRTPAGPGSGPSGWRRALRPKPVLLALAVLLCAAIITTVGSYFYLDSRLVRKDILVDYPGRPAQGAGQNWLITGSDSRQGLTKAEIRRYHTGFGISGHRSDTIMLLHLPANGGRPVLISIPRDSYVPIPGYGRDKINAAFDFGGPALLAKTIQDVTGLRIDHYMGIGFGGFVRVVDAVGGVRVCLKAPLVDPASSLHLRKGCHVLTGGEALGFVRTRHAFATQDLQRIQNQRIFLRALLRKMTSAGVILDPFKAFPAASGVVGSLTVDQGTSLYDLIRVAFALRNPITTTVPIADANYLTPNAGDAVLWNRQQALLLFRDLRTDAPIPKSLITGSTLAG